MSKKIGEEYGEYPERQRPEEEFSLEDYSEYQFYQPDDQQEEQFSIEEIIAEFKGDLPRFAEKQPPSAPVFGAPADPPAPKAPAAPRPAEPVAVQPPAKPEPPRPPEQKLPPPEPEQPEEEPVRRRAAANQPEQPERLQRQLESEPEEKPEPPRQKKQPPKQPESQPLELGESRIIDLTALAARRRTETQQQEQPEQPVHRKKPRPQPPEQEEENRVRHFPQSRRAAPPPPEPEEEPDQPPPPFDFLFEADNKDIPHTIANLGKKIRRLRGRGIFCFLLAVLGCFVTALPESTLPIPAQYSFSAVPQYYFWALNLLLCLSMLAADDVLLAGFYRLAIFRPTLDTVAAGAAFAALAQGIWCALGKGETMPYTAVAQVTLFYSVLAKRGRLLTLRRTYKAATLSATPLWVCAKEDSKQRTMAYKSQGPGAPDLSCIDRPDTTMRFSQVYSPLAVVAAVVLSVLVSFGARRPDRFLPSLAAIFAMAAPVGMLLSTATPGTRLSKKLFTAGTALLNAKCARELAWSELAVLTDPDIFPQGSVSISGMKIARNMSMEKAVACAAGALKAVGGGLSFVFSDFAKQQYIFVPEPTRVQYYENGGISAQIGRDSVLCGSASFLTRMGVHVSEGRTIKSGVFVAVNSAFAGVFALKYNAQPQNLSAFRVLRLGRLRPVLAVKDFNVTPFMVEDKFELKPGQAEFPEIEKRVALAAECEQGMPGAKPLALLSRNAMLSFCECVAAARRLCRAVRFNLVCSTIAAVFGMGLMYFLASADHLQAAGPLTVVLYLLLWYVPVWLYSQLAAKI